MKDIINTYLAYMLNKQVKHTIIINLSKCGSLLAFIVELNVWKVHLCSHSLAIEKSVKELAKDEQSTFPNGDNTTVCSNVEIYCVS